jgi:hypothetical protein
MVVWKENVEEDTIGCHPFCIENTRLREDDAAFPID